MDADDDGTPDHQDNCGRPGTILVANDQADDDADGIGDACDETPFKGHMVAGETYFYPGYEGPLSGPGEIQSTAWVRCKTQLFNQDYDQFGKSWLTFITYQATFRVCYRPGGGGIVSFDSVHGDASYVRIPWDWKGNDPGYPYGIKSSAHTVAFHYRGSAAICIFSRGCGPTKHPWVTITFRDNNTMEVDAGVV